MSGWLQSVETSSSLPWAVGQQWRHQNLTVTHVDGSPRNVFEKADVLWYALRQRLFGKHAVANSKVGDGCGYVHLMFDGLSYHAPDVARNSVKGCTIAGAHLLQLACMLTVSRFCAASFQMSTATPSMIFPAAADLYSVSIWAVVPFVWWYRLAHSSRNGKHSRHLRQYNIDR